MVKFYLRLLNHPVSLLSVFTCLFISCSNNQSPVFEELVLDSMHVQYLGKDSTPMYLPADLHIELWAESPMFYNPTNIDVDHRGRVWVTEAVNYRNYNAGKDNRLKRTEGDRVMILEDTDGDGMADLSKVFVQDTDLVSPLGIAVMGNRVIVSCSPKMIMYTDTTGDDQADTKEVLLEGFGGVDHDHSLHSVIGGPDGNWYFNVGNAGPHIVKDKSGWTLRSGSMYTGGSPYNKKNQGHMKSDDGEVWTGGMAFSMLPGGDRLRVYAHNFRNSYEIAMDSYGTMWQNDNDDQMMACRTSYVMEYGNAGYFNEDGTRSWQGDRRPGQDVFTAHWHQEDPGVSPAGDNTGAGSPTGVVVNEGDGLGKKYRGLLLSAEAGKNVIYAYKPKPTGAGYEFKRHHLISSIPSEHTNYKWREDTLDTRMWFRPSDVCVGTDGALFIADWYDPIVGGHMMRELKGYGRIYRITAGDKNKTINPAIDHNSITGLISAFQNPAIQVRYQAMIQLKDSGTQVLPAVIPLLKNENQYIRMRTIWLLSQLGPEDIKIIERIYKKGNEDEQVVAYRALRKFNSAKLLEYSRQGLKNYHKALHREIAFALKDQPFIQVKGLIDTLLKGYDGKDPYYLTSLAIVCKHREDSVYNLLLKPILDSDNWQGKSLDILHALHPNAACQNIIQQIHSKPGLPLELRLMNTLAFITDTAVVKTMLELTASKDSAIAANALWWLSFRRTNDWQDLVDWSAYDSLMVTPAAKKLNSWLDHIAKTRGKKQLQYAIEMALDEAGGLALLSLLTNDKLDKTIRKVVQDTIFSNPSPLVRAMAGDMFWKKNKQYSIDVIKRMEMNKDSGRIVFNKACITCHRFNDKGGQIGPDLSEIGNKMDIPSLLDAIIQPNAGIAFGFETYTVETKSGKTITGFLLSEGQTLQIKDILGHVHEIPGSQIRKKIINKASLMPAPQYLNLSDVDLANVTAFLKNL